MLENIKLLDCIYENKTTYLILEYCPDGDLRSYLRKVKK